MSSQRLVIMAVVGVFSSANANVLFVDDDNCPGPGSGAPGDPYCSIQDAIDAALDSDEIVVAPGTYFEMINFLGKAITLRSFNGPEVTTIDAQSAGTVVTCDTGEGPDTVLEGFTITGGSGGFLIGGGMFNDNNSSPTVTDCTFSDNTAVLAGGGMFNDNNSSPTVTDCTFSGNLAPAGAGMANCQSSPTVIDCTFSGNPSTGTGGGMHNENGSNAIVTNCTFSGNSAGMDGGGMYNSFSLPTVTNCTFSGNTADANGGGIKNEGGMPTLTNCTFSLNSATNGRALAFDSVNQQNPSDFTMTNCIVWNGGDGIWNNDGSTITIGYSDVQGGWFGAGSNNIDADPLFVDAFNGDFRLSPGSPGIDAGNNAAIADLADTDLDGNPRFADDAATTDTGCGVPVIVDMGAYEFQGDPFPVKFADLDGDGIVGIVDFLAFLAVWGSCVDQCCLADLDLDGDVGISDFLTLLGSWG